MKNISKIHQHLDNRGSNITKGFSDNSNRVEKAGPHKYFKRTGTRGHYKYYYTEAEYHQARAEEKGQARERRAKIAGAHLTHQDTQKTIDLLSKFRQINVRTIKELAAGGQSAPESEQALAGIDEMLAKLKPHSPAPTERVANLTGSPGATRGNVTDIVLSDAPAPKRNHITTQAKPIRSVEGAKKEIDIMMKQADALLEYQRTPSMSYDQLKDGLVYLHNQSHPSLRYPSGFAEFVENNRDNALPNNSSGSFLTGLTDIDGLLSAMGWEGDDTIPESMYDEAANYWRGQLSSRRAQF